MYAYLLLNLLIFILTPKSGQWQCAQRNAGLVLPGRKLFLLTCPLGKAPNKPHFNPVLRGKLDFSFFLPLCDQQPGFGGKAKNPAFQKAARNKLSHVEHKP